jgi:RNA polymerase sigma factor (sigma-70 family)
MSESRTSHGFFQPTIWSTIYKAKRGEEAERMAALERLLARYRQPILNHITASLSGHNRTPERAEDLTQEFLYRCLRMDFLKHVGQEHGRFRTFIKACIANFLRDQHDHDSAKKRNSGDVPRSLDETDDDGNPLLEPAAAAESPENQLDRQWALTVLEQSLAALKQECVNARRGELFDALKGHLDRASEPATAAEIGSRLGMSEGAVHTAMNRLRRRLGELISEEVRQTVGDQENWREELAYLVQLLG